MKKKMLPLLAPTLLLLAAMLAGCNKDETDANQLPDGKHPLTLTATMEGLTATRATPDGTWDGTEKVAVIIDNATVQEYTVAADGKLTAPSDVTPYYWQNATETKSVLAWFPYSATKPDKFEVKADQSGDGYAQSDMLWSSKEITYKNSALEFKHLPAKVVVNLKNGEGVTESEVQNATVTLVNQNLTSGTIAADWSVTAVTTGNSEIKTNVLTTPATDFQKTVQALVAPQQMQNKQFIKVTIGTDAAARDYYYTTAADDANLESGTQYTYAITVKKGGITVTTSGATDWTGSETLVTSTEIAAGYAPSNLKTGDYYYSDGTTSDGGYRKSLTDGTFLQENIEPVLIDASGTERTVLGIVLKAGRDVNGDWIDDGVYISEDGNSMSVRGYVLALEDANSGDCKWGLQEKVGTNQKKETGFYGYTNTNTIKEYAKGKGKTLEETFPATYHATDAYEAAHPAPANSSGWFFPSAGQCKYWYDNRDVILTSIKKTAGNGSHAWGQYYFSSSEFTNNPMTHVWDMQIGTIGIQSGGGDKNSNSRVRSILAF